MEGLGRHRRVLAGHGVHDEQRLDRIDRRVDGRDLLHHLLVDGEAPCRIDDEHVVEPALGVCHRALGNRDGAFVGGARHETGARLRSQRLQLVNGRRPVDVRADHGDLAALAVLEVARELGHRGRLASALQSRHQDDRGRRRGEIQGIVRIAHEVDEFLVHDLDEGLPAVQRSQHFAADGALLDIRRETAHDRKGDVGLQECDAHLPDGVADVVLGKTAAAGNVPQGAGQALCEAFEHHQSNGHETMPRESIGWTRLSTPPARAHNRER